MAVVALLFALAATLCSAEADLVRKEFAKHYEANQPSAQAEAKRDLIRQARGDNSHFCCVQDLTKPISMSGVKVITAYKEESYLQAAPATNCGTFGWSKCAAYVVQTKAVLYTYSTLFDYDQARSCNNNHVVCCDGYLPIRDGDYLNCIHSSALDPEQKTLMMKFMELGILGKK